MITSKTAPAMSRSIKSFFQLIFHYFFFSRATLLVLGLVAGYKIVDHSLMNFLMDYLTDAWTVEALIYKVAIVNLIEGLSGIMVLVLSFLADDFTGRYLMVIISATFYITGLSLYWTYENFLSVKMGTMIFLVTIPFLAIGRGGEYNLTEFLANQLSAKIDDTDKEKQEETVEVRKRIWLLLISFCSSLLLYFYFKSTPWRLLFSIVNLVLIIALVFFSLGKQIYIPEEKLGSPAYTFYVVIKASLFKHNLPWSEEIEDVKRLKSLAPLFLSVFLYSFAKAAGSTLFIEQASFMEGQNYALYALVIIKLFSQFFTSFLSKLYERFGKNGNRRGKRQSLLNLGPGIICSFICCLVAYITESKRAQLIRKNFAIFNLDGLIPMSAYWLTTQFNLLGVMTALVESGLEYLIYNHLKTEKMRKYAEPFASCILGIGKVLSIGWIFTFGKWFNTTVNDSRLDKYYLALSFTSLANIFFYYLLKKMFGIQDYMEQEQTGSRSGDEIEIFDDDDSKQKRERKDGIRLNEFYSTRFSWFRSRSAPTNKLVPWTRSKSKCYIRSNSIHC